MSDKKGPMTLIDLLAAAWPPDEWRDVTVLVAVSGGADSTALARGLSQLSVTGEGRLVIAHFNHALRGAESDADQAFVEQLATELGFECIVGRASSPPLPLSLSLPPVGTSEESLRNARYEFLVKTAERIGARYVATAHTADDHAETVLMNILRGTGLAGLAGIPRVRPLTQAATLIRPLLSVSRVHVLEFLASLRQPFREDASNSSPDYTRNRVRHELLPLLERDYNPHVREALTRLARFAGEADDFVSHSVRGLLWLSGRVNAQGVEIDLSALNSAADVLARAALVQVWKAQRWPLADMSFERWEELLAFARLPNDGSATTAAPRMFPGGIRAERTSGLLRLVLSSNPRS
jgi:tRNA(Ile)-lysidine synthase